MNLVPHVKNNFVYLFLITILRLVTWTTEFCTTMTPLTVSKYNIIHTAQKHIVLHRCQVAAQI